VFYNFVALNGTGIVIFDLENTPYLAMFTGTGIKGKPEHTVRRVPGQP
jgi:hypothetical protein